ncbi:unnamed protein product [Lactuca saligna]|uniref:DDE Tnp4 domain-containing protein n=1 Tax=Lactuca saligna TaxID=75948 RepID=A0AA35ZEW0_LACSI|nr:unnamed protein product [Lactuca saligna]
MMVVFELLNACPLKSMLQDVCTLWEMILEINLSLGCCSKSTTSKCFHGFLQESISLESRYIQQPKGDVVQKEIQDKKRFYPYFKNCIWAIDGSHVRVKVPNKDAPRYRGRKGYPTVIMIKEEQVGKKEQTKWTNWMDYCFIQDLLTQQDNGNKISRTFISQAYTNMLIEVGEEVWANLINSKPGGNFIEDQKNHKLQ